MIAPDDLQDMTIRLTALDKAITAHESFTSVDMVTFTPDGPKPIRRADEILATAKAFESYLRGSAFTAEIDDVPIGGTDG